MLTFGFFVDTPFNTSMITRGNNNSNSDNINSKTAAAIESNS